MFAHSWLAPILLHALVLSVATTAHAKSSSKRSGVELDLGVRYMGHYISPREPETPPQATLIEARLHKWFSERIGAYVLAGKSFMHSSTTELGAGANVMLISFSAGKKAVFQSVRFVVTADVIHYSTDPPGANQSYPESSLVLRYGGALDFSLFSPRFYLKAAGMACRVSDNFFLAPLVALGMRF